MIPKFESLSLSYLKLVKYKQIQGDEKVYLHLIITVEKKQAKYLTQFQLRTMIT
jgi:hypothetical protein